MKAPKKPLASGSGGMLFAPKPKANGHNGIGETAKKIVKKALPKTTKKK